MVEAWLAGTDIVRKEKYCAIARTAFGCVYLWERHSGQTVTTSPLNSQLLTYPPNKYVIAGEADYVLETFIATKDANSLDFEDFKEKKLFKRALKKLGVLQPDEMYGFEPALCIGGAAKLENLAKVKIVEHLLLLEQLGEITVLHIDVSRHV